MGFLIWKYSNMCYSIYISIYENSFRGHIPPLASQQTHTGCVCLIKWLRTLHDPHFAYLSLSICSFSSVLCNTGDKEKSQSTKMSRACFEMRQVHSVPSIFSSYVSPISRAILLKSPTWCHQAVVSRLRQFDRYYVLWWVGSLWLLALCSYFGEVRLS